MSYQSPKPAREEPSTELDALAATVVDAAMEVHRVLGPGYFESVYEEALCHELQLRGVAFKRQAAIAVQYKGQPVGEGRVDLLLDGGLLVELKAVEAILPVHRAQLISYLKASKARLGLLINFNVRLLRDGIMRVIWSDE